MSDNMISVINDAKHHLFNNIEDIIVHLQAILFDMFTNDFQTVHEHVKKVTTRLRALEKSACTELQVRFFNIIFVQKLQNMQ